MADLELLGADSDETRLLVDHRCGFSLPIPGHPSLRPAPDGSPAYDTLVQLADGPIELGFRLDELPGGTDPEALAVALAEGYVQSRTDAGPRVYPLRGKRRGAGVEGAASAIYVLPGSKPMMEQVHVSVRSRPGGAWAMVRTIRFSNLEIKSLVWAHFHSAIAGQEHWDPGAPRTEAPRLWPERSRFVELDMTLTLRPEQLDETRAKSEALRVIPAGEGEALVRLLTEFGNSQDPPTHALHSAVLDMAVQQIAHAAPTPDIVDPLIRNLYDVETTHDLRGWVWQCLYAFDRRHQA